MRSDDEDDSIYLEDDSDDDDGDSGYDGDNDDPPDNDHSAYGSIGYTSQGPESVHPASPELMADVEKILGLLGPRLRNSGPSAVGTPKEGAVRNC
jgi:hypothetical protein